MAGREWGAGPRHVLLVVFFSSVARMLLSCLFVQLTELTYPDMKGRTGRHPVRRKTVTPRHETVKTNRRR